MKYVKMVKQPLPPGAMPDLCASACIHVHQSATSLNSLTGDVNINDSAGKHWLLTFIQMDFVYLSPYYALLQTNHTLHSNDNSPKLLNWR